MSGALQKWREVGPIDHEPVRQPLLLDNVGKNGLCHGATANVAFHEVSVRTDSRDDTTRTEAHKHDAHLGVPSRRASHCNLRGSKF